jgi:hypothetical protein
MSSYVISTESVETPSEQFFAYPLARLPWLWSLPRTRNVFISVMRAFNFAAKEWSVKQIARDEVPELLADYTEVHSTP